MSLPPFSHDVNTQYTESPNASWSFGQKVDTTAAGKEWLEGEKEGWKIIDTEKEDHIKLYQLMISGIVPRPIAFIATISEDGIENLAPFSWFNMVTHNPPIISFACSNGPVHFKDTRTNVTNGLGFTVNIISEPFIEQANSTSIDAPPSFDEWSISGLTKEPAIHVKASRVKESAFSMECELHQAIDITQPTTGAITTTLILARVKYIHVRKDMLNERGNVDATKFKAVGRLGDISYARVGDAFRLPRPIWTQEEDKINGLLAATGHL
ncbi:hypothetical protein SERLA73DRAFT_82279 [Serpula lacrymans var. lacrymans S7.3]|uniref:Flavin reductase like domain-containing protein n=2 Tax=Serpula lacrymans var. lacrymans TaxID=341189 RepID=F8PFA1_SERL3|nr:uncharacterized protein SERLADRAFT_444261 [Serpula lacrymans var. lacrymans S7.9]EGO04207.1 hypothetical protein SERLA73DRAFT_82279 [Serpula lacrymans var. lacrymans S7.3]EGO30147.1 hypothetical protein SERLADRAFT_444261 [Serpula lacrymans var. lacrymans S7.9]